MELTDYLAVYGAGLSTAIAVWNYFRSRPKIRVQLIYSIEKIEGELKSGMGIFVQNPSTQAAHITSVSFLYLYSLPTLRSFIKHVVQFKQLPRRHGWCGSALSNFGLDSGCPVSIEPGKSHKIFVPEEVLEELLGKALSRSIKVQVQDALWRNKYSKKFEWPERKN